MMTVEARDSMVAEVDGEGVDIMWASSVPAGEGG